MFNTNRDIRALRRTLTRADENIDELEQDKRVLEIANDRLHNRIDTLEEKVKSLTGVIHILNYPAE